MSLLFFQAMKSKVYLSAYFTIFLGLGVLGCGNQPPKSSESVVASYRSLPIDSALEVDTAIFAGGCFWCTEAQFDLLRGVDTVISGYTGGKTDNPTYHQVISGKTGHAEAVMVIFDPVIISYDKLLEVFFTGHDPTQLNRQGNDIGTQYRSAIFVRTKQQWDKAKFYINKLNEEVFDHKIVTQLQLASKFYPAEDSHQKYMSKNPKDAYCTIVIQPKLKKIKELFGDVMK